MAEFVRAQIFGTTFEITSRFVTYLLASIADAIANRQIDTQTFSRLAWELSASFGGYSNLETRTYA